MTKRKPNIEGRHSKLELNLYRARKIAADLEDGTLGVDERQFLIQALRRIGDGEDANEVLGVKAKRGERKSKESRRKAEQVIFDLPFISSLMSPPPDGWGLTFDEALERAAKTSSLSEDTLRTYWFNNPHLRGPRFAPPISAYPIRRMKPEK
jgi:hypothetical protein